MPSPNKSVNHTRKVYGWDHLGLAAVQQIVAWEKVVRNSIGTSPNETLGVCICPFSYNMRKPPFYGDKYVWNIYLWGIKRNPAVRSTSAIPLWVLPHEWFSTYPHPTENQNLCGAAPSYGNHTHSCKTGGSTPLQPLSVYLSRIFSNKRPSIFTS